MVTQYRCGRPARRSDVRDAEQPALNGIDYLEVDPADDSERTLFVHFLHPLPGQPGGVPAMSPTIGPDNIFIEGGVRVRDVRANAVMSRDKILQVTVDRAGDYSSYSLGVVQSTLGRKILNGFDPQLSIVEFGFKVNCPSDFDCRDERICPPEKVEEPIIDYLARDYASFRRLMLDRLATTIPLWRERNPADQMIAAVEVLAYVADKVSYFQDAVATEAYLGTARSRVSVRRHARLLDYWMHDGCNARAWVVLEVDATVQGRILRGPNCDKNRPGALLLTRTSRPRGNVERAGFARLVLEQPTIFETMEDVSLHHALNEIPFYTWRDTDCCLPKGATRATLRNEGHRLETIGPSGTMDLLLKVGQVLILEEVVGPDGGLAADADPTHRHAVRLRTVAGDVDPLTGTPIVEVSWTAADALPFALCLSAHGRTVAVARGNVVLADHGHTVTFDPLTEQGRPETWVGPWLKHWPVTRQGYLRSDTTAATPHEPAAPGASKCVPVRRGGELNGPILVDPCRPATAAMACDPRDTVPAIYLRQGGPVAGWLWLPERDLLNSGPFETDFVVETEEDGRVRLRFGDGRNGMLSSDSDAFYASYRVGNGLSGNVGPEAIAHIVGEPGVVNVRNPLAAKGGTEPEPIDEVKLYAPQAFRRQERAVTAADYAEMAQRHPDVSRAVATRRWTGSWHTIYLTVDRRLGKSVDREFEDKLREFIEQYRLTGHDLEIDGPQFVALEIVMVVCVKPGYFRDSVKRALLDVFSNRDLPDGRRGFFHPDEFTFGNPVYLSRVTAQAMGVPGVQWVDLQDDGGNARTRFRRWGRDAEGASQAGRIDMGRLEIARLDNDPNDAENGVLDFLMQGGM